MSKSEPENICRKALKNVKLTFKGDDLFTECQNWCKILDIPD